MISGITPDRQSNSKTLVTVEAMVIFKYYPYIIHPHGIQAQSSDVCFVAVSHYSLDSCRLSCHCLLNDWRFVHFLPNLILNVTELGIKRQVLDAASDIGSVVGTLKLRVTGTGTTWSLNHLWFHVFDMKIHGFGSVFLLVSLALALRPATPSPMPSFTAMGRCSQVVPFASDTSTTESFTAESVDMPLAPRKVGSRRRKYFLQVEETKLETFLKDHGFQDSQKRTPRLIKWSLVIVISIVLQTMLQPWTFGWNLDPKIVLNGSDLIAISGSSV